MVSPIDKNIRDAVLINGASVGASPLKAMTVEGRRPSASRCKKDQLLALIAKPSGAKISVLSERLGWQAHTVRAALSRLRSHGHQVLATKAPKTGEAIYRLVTPTPAEVAASGVEASEV